MKRINVEVNKEQLDFLEQLAKSLGSEKHLAVAIRYCIEKLKEENKETSEGNNVRIKKVS